MFDFMKVLLIEDNPGDVRLTQEALKEVLKFNLIYQLFMMVNKQLIPYN
ncbi:MAG: hypothetical protein ACJAZ3_000996 [Sphingobacteriales bacterium]|jgi:hypothetical protein